MLVTNLSQDVLSDLIIDNEEHEERHRSDPIHTIHGGGAKGHVQERGIDKENDQESLLDNTHVQDHVVEAVVNNGIDTSLTDDDVGHLGNYNGHQVSSLGLGKDVLTLAVENTSVLVVDESTSTSVGDSFKILIISIITPLVTLFVSKERGNGEMSDTVEHNEETSEGGNRLNHTNLQVRPRDQLHSHELILHAVTRRLLHDIQLRELVSKRDSGQHISTKINAQNHDGGQSKGHTESNLHKEGRNLRDVTGQSVGN
mmetsp:Transcript_6695/g.10974  ORF Transcript_6695/g.10974 Transcript_6695/m.10974 type:complete len:257 (-) Transcript_6695:2503-3273(-)